MKPTAGGASDHKRRLQPSGIVIDEKIRRFITSVQQHDPEDQPDRTGIQLISDSPN